jgi:hypothetical protein
MNIVGWDDGYGGGEVAGDTIRDQNGNNVDASQLPQNFAATTPQTLAASASRTQIELKPLRVIRPDRIVFDRVAAAACNLDNVTVGTTSLNASNGSIPADAFAPDAVGTAMRCTVTASPNLSIFFTVTNKTAAAILLFAIGIIGPSIQA